MGDITLKQTTHTGLQPHVVRCACMQELESSGFEDTEMKQQEFLRDKIATCTQLSTKVDVKKTLVLYVVALEKCDDASTQVQVLHASSRKQFDAVVEVVSCDVSGAYSFLAQNQKRQTKSNHNIHPLFYKKPKDNNKQQKQGIHRRGYYHSPPWGG